MRVVTPACLLLLRGGCLALAFGFELAVANRSSWGGMAPREAGGARGPAVVVPGFTAATWLGP